MNYRDLPSKIETERSDAYALSNRGRTAEAEKRLKELISYNSSNPSPQVQDSVARARMSLGHLAARRKDFASAEKTFRIADVQYKGTGEKDPDFGRLDDQAAYQAAVCLQAQGKKQEAVEAYVRFMTDRPLSPLNKAVRQRLVLLNPEQTETYDRMFDEGAIKRQKQAKIDVALCGPKVMCELLKRSGKRAPSLKEAQTECKTDENGTSFADLQAALLKHGITTEGKLLNRRDFAALNQPAIWAQSDHFTLILSVSTTSVKVFDPMTGGERQIALPPVDDATFSATLLVAQSQK
ncbi:MAG: hypothetical protein JNM34_08230 [Chthonomonadaceae bacterium]|nr:hypothetical protein [Chthonomonadaceae bacterium]